MGSNASVARFKTDMKQFAKSMAVNMHDEVLKQADELIDNMRAAIEHSESGHLSASVRKEDVSQLGIGGQRVSVLVRAGGQLTLRRTSTGHVYDYSLAEEFGTSKETPRPFFFSTFRFYQQQGLELFRETFEQTIEENNRVRALRSQNYSNRFANVSVGYRGAVVR